MSGTGYRIFINPCARGEEAGHEVEVCVIGLGCHHDAANTEISQSCEIRCELSHDAFRFDFNQVVEARASDEESGFETERMKQSFRRFAVFRRCGREIEFD